MDFKSEDEADNLEGSRNGAEKRKSDFINLLNEFGKLVTTENQEFKLSVEKEEELMDTDRHKVQELFWWCMTASALITYFFKLYK